MHELAERDPSELELDPETNGRVVFHGPTAHGWLDVDVPMISHIDGNIYMGGCYGGGVTLPAHFEHVLSLYQGNEWIIQHRLQSHLRITMYDLEDQGMEQVDGLARWVLACAQTGHVLVNCQAGLNRSGVVTARALQMQGMSGAEAIATVRKNRCEAALFNKAFEQWLLTR
jgi:protein-tyrosine phosphatase